MGVVGLQFPRNGAIAVADYEWRDARHIAEETKYVIC